MNGTVVTFAGSEVSQNGFEPAWFATDKSCNRLIAWLENSQRSPRLTVKFSFTRQSSPKYAAMSYSLKPNFGGPSVRANCSGVSARKREKLQAFPLYAGRPGNWAVHGPNGNAAEGVLSFENVYVPSMFGRNTFGERCL